MSKAFELKFEAEAMGNVQYAEITLGLDIPAKAFVRTVLDPAARKDLALANIADTLEAQVLGRGVFKGEVSKVRQVGTHVLETIYTDAMGRLENISESEFSKGMRLEDFLRSVATQAGLRAKFSGKFSTEIGGRDLAGKSYHDHLLELSEEFGFFFCVNSVAEELCLFALGSFRNALNLESPKVLSVTATQRAHALRESAEVMGFDSAQGKGTKAELSAHAMYESLGFLKEAGSFDTRRSWPQSKGRYETVTPPDRSVEQTKQALCARLAKQAALGDEVLVTCLQVALPADQVELGEGFAPAQRGKYLVLRSCIRLGHAKPRCELTLVRA